MAKTTKQTFPTIDEAKANKPADHENWKLYCVSSPDGTARFIWAPGHGDALVQVVKAAGWSVSSSDRLPTPEKVAGLLAQLSPEARAALLAQYATPANGEKAPEKPQAQPRKPAGK